MRPSAGARAGLCGALATATSAAAASTRAALTAARLVALALATTALSAGLSTLIGARTLAAALPGTLALTLTTATTASAASTLAAATALATTNLSTATLLLRLCRRRGLDVGSDLTHEAGHLGGLGGDGHGGDLHLRLAQEHLGVLALLRQHDRDDVTGAAGARGAAGAVQVGLVLGRRIDKIGRASCRERV